MYRHMAYHIALSYAGDDKCFVEHVASILKRYIGVESVFHYTTGHSKTNIRAFFDFINSSLHKDQNSGNGDAVRTICFVREVDGNNRIVVGQQTELLDSEERQVDAGLKTWQGVTNSRSASNLQLKTLAVVLPNHRMTSQKLKQWSVPFDLNCFGQGTLLCDLAIDIDYASAEYVAEWVLRDIFRFRPLTHSCKVFTYEKDTISFYAELMQDLRKKKTFSQLDEERRKHLTDFFNSGVPLLWPSVRLRTDIDTQPNTLLETGAIGTARSGLRPLFNEDQLLGDKDPVRMVVSAALSQHHECGALDSNPDACMIRSGLSFPEAGPRNNVMKTK